MSERNYDKLAAAAGQNVKEKNFWLSKLAGEWVKTGFPRDYNNGTPAGAYDKTLITFNHDLLSRLAQLSKDSDVKLHMIFTAALVVLLEKYTGSRDIIIGSPIYKQETDIEFINTVLILRNQIKENMTFRELLLQVKEDIALSTQHQNYPVEILLEQLDIPYREKENEFPLFDVVIMHENIHYKKYLQYIPYQMLFSCKKTGIQIEILLEYNPGLYRESTINQIVHHYCGLLKAVLFNVEQPLSDINIMSEEEKQRILIDFNNTVTGFPQDITINEEFEEQVEKTPDHIALVSEELLKDYQLTYRELNRKANQLACFLRNKGVKPGHIVALMVEKSLEMMVGILGILKAGAAYLPIDFSYPPGRVQYMMDESGANVLLTYGENTLPTKLVDPAFGTDIVDILSPGVYKTDSSNLERINRPGDAAYIIYTSGSTGKPKGVLVEHCNVMAYLQAFFNQFKMSARDTALQQASYSFDAFVEEVYPLLFTGGKVAVCPKYVLLDSSVLLRFILKHDITFISVSPLLLNEINQLPETGSIRTFISGGDELKKDYITNLLARGSVYNTYGPTETTVCATYYQCSANDINPPIGKPIANYRVIIADARHQLVPIGVPGELCISGPGVTRGYLNRPELTNDKFDHDLWDYQDYHDRYHRSYMSYRSYRTGDLARWLPDGNIQFLGRIDKQVSIRGFRVELGEIENRLLAHESIGAALVLVKNINKNKTGDIKTEQRHLCAYITSSRELSVPGIREYLSSHLPDYMVPAYYVLLERMPLTPHGKPDIKTLDSYEPISAAQAEYIAPTTETELIIANIWKELLHLDRISIHDNFFDIGGNSMLLLKATNKLREAFKFKGDIPFIVMFQYTTIQLLSEYLDQVEVDSIAISQKYNQQAEALDKGKNRMKKFIKRTKEVSDG